MTFWAKTLVGTQKKNANQRQNKLKFRTHMKSQIVYVISKEKCYMHNIFTKQQILRGSLILPIIGGLKSNLNNGFKFEPVTTYHQ